MNLGKLKEEWGKDSDIDFTEVGEESLKTAKLHSKYINELTSARYLLKLKYLEQDSLKVEKIDFYKGRATAEVYKNKKAPDILKQEAPEYVRGDTEVIELNKLVAGLEEKVEFLKGVIHQLNNRNWQIKNYIDWVKFKAGAGGG